VLRAERCAGVTNYLRGDAVARGLEVGVLQDLCSAGAVAGVAVGHGEEERQQNKAHVVVELVGRQRSIAQRVYTWSAGGQRDGTGIRPSR
jgi:hypothetical protein